MGVIQRTTEVVEVDPLAPASSIIKRAADLLRQGELVVFPTETVYGLGADAFQPAALAGIFLAKGRPLSDPLIVHIAEYETLDEVVSSVSPTARLLIEVFWPGPLTLVLPRGPRVPYIVTAGWETVAVRMPRHPVALALIRALDSPIAAPSANRFMHVSPTTAAHALEDLRGRVPLILDGGPCNVGVESTILDLSAAVPTILRPGGISLEALRTVLPEVHAPISHQASPTEISQKAPGQLTTHYAPTIPLILFEGSEKDMRAALKKELDKHLAQGKRVGLLIADTDLPAFQQSDALVYSLGDTRQPAQLAANLFASLRALEEARVQVILCRTFPARELGLAIHDRLRRAAGGKIWQV